MLRHELQPGKLVAGTLLIVVGALYAGDARGAWETPWYVAIPLVTGGLFLAGAVGFLTGRVRRRRASGRTTTDEPGPDRAA
ncbi:hypothetical protein ACH4GM_12775 [Streptomyces coeruleorubidus]|uniref:hypothetical protein n=1 Tax=Streptomyces coeruleorubidus TaxID=116188 RepID=UPI00379BCF07